MRPVPPSCEPQSVQVSCPLDSSNTKPVDLAPQYLQDEGGLGGIAVRQRLQMKGGVRDGQRAVDAAAAFYLRSCASNAPQSSHPVSSFAAKHYSLVTTNRSKNVTLRRSIWGVGGRVEVCSQSLATTPYSQSVITRHHYSCLVIFRIAGSTSKWLFIV